MIGGTEERSAGGALSSAFADVSLIEAANEREEATAIAIALRLALERPGQDGESRAALITPDRNLARRVMAELSRFGILADDSAGTPLAAMPQGTLLQLLLEAALRPGDPVAIVSLLKHPLARFGTERDALISATEVLGCWRCAAAWSRWTSARSSRCSLTNLPNRRWTGTRRNGERRFRPMQPTPHTTLPGGSHRRPSRWLRR